MKSPFHTPQFKELQQEYYQKLEESGFEDIEDRDSANEWLKNWNMTIPSSDCGGDKEEYFYMATQFLNICDFKNETEKRIWEMHTEGLSIREISGTYAVKGFSKSNIFKIIKKIQAMMLYRFK